MANMKKYVYPIWMTTVGILAVAIVFFMLQGVIHKLNDQKDATSNAIKASDTNATGLIDAQVKLAALAKQLRKHNITPVVTPAVAPPVSPSQSITRILQPTLAQVETGLRIICGGTCKGDKGDSVTGPKGDKGDTVVGAPGPKGDKGDSITGPQGDPGRGIASMSCTGGLSPVTYTVTYTDGTTQDFTCGTIPPVSPSRR